MFIFVRRETGLVTLISQDGADQMIDILSSLDVKCEYFQGHGVSKRFPGISLGKYSGAIYEPSGSVLKADACLKAFQVCIIDIIFLTVNILTC